MTKQIRNSNFNTNARKKPSKRSVKQGTGKPRDKPPQQSGWNPADADGITAKDSQKLEQISERKPRRNHKSAKLPPRATTNFNNKNAGRSRGMKTHDHMDAKPHKLSRNTIKDTSIDWIWGFHALKAALDNPRRTHHTLYVSPTMKDRLGGSLDGFMGKIHQVHPKEIDILLPDGAVHQGGALHAAPLPAHDLETIAGQTMGQVKGLIIVLDQITDPHNVGAIFRLAAAFGAKGVILQTRGAPPLAGATAKVAVGTLETVPHVLVTNIANTLLALQDMGWRVTGLAGEADINLEQAFTKTEAEVVVMGAEGPGLRKRVRDCCDQLAKIPMPGTENYGAESLNVSTAAAIALYEVARGLA